MNNLLLKLKRFGKQVLGFLPSRLPTGIPQFEVWANDITNTYNLPTKDDTSIRYILATCIINLTEGTTYKSKFHFFKIISNAASRQIAGFVFHDIKTKQREAAEAAKTSDIQK